MPNRALASAFGGIADFLKLQRGLQNETADRKQAAERHGLQLALGKGQERLLGIQGVRGEFENKNLARDDTRKTADWLRGWGPSAMTPEVTRGLFGTENPNIAEGLNASIAKQIEREGRSDKIQGEQVTQAGLTTGQMQDTRNARDEIKTIPGFDPQMKPADAFKALQAGYVGASQPIYGQLREDAKTQREFVDEQRRKGEAAAYGLQRLSQQGNSTPGSNPGIDRAIATQMAPVMQGANQLQTAINRTDAQVAQIEAKKEANIKLLGSTNAVPENNKLDWEINRIRNKQLLQIDDAYASGDNLTQMFTSMPGVTPQVLASVQALLKSNFVGLPTRPTKEQLAVAQAQLAADAAKTPTKDPNAGRGQGQRIPRAGRE